MSNVRRIFITLGCVFILILGWATSFNKETEGDIQLNLIKRAEALIEDKIYIRAVPILLEALTFDTEDNYIAEEYLKKVYLAMGETRSFEELLNAQIAREDVHIDLFREAVDYYFTSGNYRSALNVLKDGIQKTQSEELTELYEKTRYAYKLQTLPYEEITSVSGGMIQVKRFGLWGFANISGSIVLPCIYDEISTFSNNSAIVRKDGEVFTIDGAGYRTALLKSFEADALGAYNEGIVTMLTNDGWIRANSEFAANMTPFDEIGMLSYGYAPVKSEGKWGVIVGSGNEYLLEPEYDNVIQDELGRCYAQNALFAEKDGGVYLFVKGEEGLTRLETKYQDARPFEGGWAAVKKDGKWGYINNAGEVMIDFEYSDALSFNSGMAAVEKDGKWGYINTKNVLVIEPAFEKAKSVYSGRAFVFSDESWQVLILLEY